MSKNPPSATSNISAIFVPGFTLSWKHSSPWASMLMKYAVHCCKSATRKGTRIMSNKVALILSIKYQSKWCANMEVKDFLCCMSEGPIPSFLLRIEFKSRLKIYVFQIFTWSHLSKGFLSTPVFFFYFNEIAPSVCLLFERREGRSETQYTRWIIKQPPRLTVITTTLIFVSLILKHLS